MENKPYPAGVSLNLAFSLLWLEAKRNNIIQLNKQCMADLDVHKLLDFITLDEKSKYSMQEIFQYLCQDEKTINYRLDVIDDFLHYPTLEKQIQELFPTIRELKYYNFHLRRENLTALKEVIWRLRELEHYVKCIQKLSNVFKPIQSKLCSNGLKKLSYLIIEIEGTSTFKNLRTTLPELLDKINNLKSITIGVNLNNGLIPHQATLISINNKKFTNAPLVNKLIGPGEWHGIAPLHSAPQNELYDNPLMTPLFADISNIMQKITKPLAKSLKKFVNINSMLLIKLEEDFLFYISAVKLIKTLQNCGLPMKRPQVLVKEKRCLDIQGCYNINLAIHLLKQNTANPEKISSLIVKNNFIQNEQGRVVILTGPNRGGKTTFLQAIGLSQILMQVGLYVPAQKATMSMVDNIFTHYPAQEELEKGTGRFGEEAQRLNEIFASATRISLILLNESLSTTSIGESLYLAQDMVRVLRMMGTRVIYTTHLHQLAAMVNQINTDTEGDSKLISMVAMIEKEPNTQDKTSAIKPTFKIIPGPPMGHSYALELASRFGISKDQLIEKLKKRGQL